MPKQGISWSCWMALVFVVVFGSAATDAVAQADPAGLRVVIERFTGPQGGSMRSLLVASLEDKGVVVVPNDEVRDKASEIFGHTELTEEDFVRVAEALRVSAFIDGRVSRQRRRWALRVTARNAADGAELGTARWSGRTVGTLRAIRRNGHSKLADYLASASAVAPVQTPPPETVAPAQAARDGSAWYSAGPDEEDPNEEEDEVEQAPGPRARGHDAVRVGLLLGTLKRSLGGEVLVRPALRVPPNVMPADLPLVELREYNSRGLGHLEVGLTAELFPGALLEDPVVEWLGIAFQFRNSLFLRTTAAGCHPMDPSEPEPARCPNPETDVTPGTVDVATTQREVYVGAKVDYGFGGIAGGPFIHVDIGFGRFLFDLEPADLAQLQRHLIVPPLAYNYLQLGGGLKVGVHEMLLIGARFAYRPTFDVGDDARRIWGVQTTGARGFVVGGDLIHPMKWAHEDVYAMLSVEYFRFSTRFRGPTACREPDSMNLCDPSELWEPWYEDNGPGFTESLHDNYLRLGLTIGYAYR